jgi:uncharacterized protein (TIRG00374 family)
MPRHFVAKSFLIVAMAALLYAIAALALGWDGIRSKIIQFPLPLLLIMAGLSLLNYVIRFFRWELYLRELGCPIPFRQSLGLYFSAYVMVITPGKVGEVFKAAIMREKFDVPLALGIPVVLAERIYDFLAVLFLAIVGLFFWPGSFAGLTTGLALAATFPLFLVLFRSQKVRSRLLHKLGNAPLLKNHSLALDRSLSSLDRLLTFRQLLISLALTVVAWMGECLGLWCACRGLAADATVLESTFVYAAGTLVGSVSFLPGGVGGTEAVIIFLLQSLDIDASAAASAALLVRIFTLWLAVVLGLVFYLIYRKDLFGSRD